MEIYELGDTGLKNIMIYGAPGSGKTHLACTIAETKKTLLFDVDLGARTLNNLPSSITKNIVPISYTKFEDLHTIYSMLKNNNTAEKWNSFFKQKGINKVIKRPFEAIVVDSLSELQRKMILELTDDTIESKMKKPEKIQQLQIKHWGQVSNLTETVVADAFGALDIIFVCTAHEQMKDNDETGESTGTPQLKGSLAFTIAKYYDFVGRLAFARTGERVLLTAPQKGWQAKTRGKHEPMIVNPTMKDIVGG